MQKIINTLYQKIIELIFPNNQIEEIDNQIVTEMVRINRNEGDRVTKYPCPAYSFFQYKVQKVQNMIWKLKYHGNKPIAEFFAKTIYNIICDELAELAQWSDFKNPVLVAIPVSPRKLRLRGFNQSEAICKALSRLDENRFFTHLPHVLYKIKDTQSQAKVKDKKTRLQNLKDSFKIKDNGLVKNRNIILLDDVLTTGATLTEATLVLKSAGAKNIIWIAVAH